MVVRFDFAMVCKVASAARTLRGVGVVEAAAQYADRASSRGMSAGGSVSVVALCLPFCERWYAFVMAAAVAGDCFAMFSRRVCSAGSASACSMEWHREGQEEAGESAMLGGQGMGGMLVGRFLDASVVHPKSSPRDDGG